MAPLSPESASSSSSCGRYPAIATRILECGAEREVRRGRVAPAVAQLLLLKPQRGTAAKPQRWGDLYTNRTSPGSASANINMDSPRDGFKQFM